MNPAVQEAIRPDRAGWDLVVFDEAHRLTPTATSYHQVGRLLAKNTPRSLLMSATAQRGKEWLFRHLLLLVVLGGGVGTAYQGWHWVLSKHWAVASLLAAVVAAVLAAIMVWLRS